jgi:hypothetical protein
MRVRKHAAAIIRASARLDADQTPRSSVHSEKNPRGEFRMVAGKIGEELVVRTVVQPSATGCRSPWMVGKRERDAKRRNDSCRVVPVLEKDLK